MRNPRILLYIALLVAIANIVVKMDAPPQIPFVHAAYSCKVGPSGSVVKPRKRINGAAPVSELV